MYSRSNRISGLFGNRKERLAKGRRQRRADRVLLTAAEQLEQRAVLDVSAAYFDDFTSSPGSGNGASWNNGNQGHGVLVVTIDNAGGSDDVYMRVVNGSYQISKSPLV